MNNSPTYIKDLVVLVADLDAENAVRGLLQRWKSLGIRQLNEGKQLDIRRHLQRDPGCRCNAEGFLEGFVRTHGHALIVFDHDGCGWEDRPPEKVESDLEARLSKAGWAGRNAAVVIAPELEAWVWSDSPHVTSELGWHGRDPTLREWLESENFLAATESKPSDPKAAMERAMRHAQKPISSHIFARLAETIGLNRCKDRAFLKFKTVLREWFPANPTADCMKIDSETQS